MLLVEKHNLYSIRAENQQQVLRLLWTLALLYWYLALSKTATLRRKERTFRDIYVLALRWNLFSAKAHGKSIQFYMVLPATVAMVTFPCCRADAGTTIPWGLRVPVMALGIC